MSKIRNINGSGKSIIFTLFLSFASFALIMACDSPTNPPPNIAPTADAGTAQIVELAADLEVVLDGSGADTDGTIASYAWTLDSKPLGASDPVITDADKATATVSGFDTEGNYVFQLVVTDDKGEASAPSTVTVTVNAAVNQAPTAVPSTDTPSVQLAQGLTVDLIGSGNDPDGTIKSYDWSLKTKPAGSAFTFSSTEQNPIVSGFDKTGEYVFELVVTDNENAASAPVTVKVTVTAADAPDVNNIAISGGNLNGGKYHWSDTLTLGGNTAATGNTYAWTCTPDTLAFDKTAAAPVVSGFARNGSYQFTLTVTNQFGVSANKSIAVNIQANTAPSAPTTNTPAGGAMTSTGLTVALNGVSVPDKDSDGDTVTYRWTCESYNAGSYTVTNAGTVASGINSALATGTTADLTLKKAGKYTFKLTASDVFGGVTSSTPVTVNVTPWNATKMVEVTYPGIIPGKTLTFAVPSVSGGGFESGDVTYTITYDNGEGDSGSLTDIMTNADLYVMGKRYSFTQTFYDKSGTAIDSFVVMADVTPPPGNHSFNALSDGEGNLLPATPSIELNLEKAIPEVN